MAGIQLLITFTFLFCSFRSYSILLTKAFVVSLNFSFAFVLFRFNIRTRFNFTHDYSMRISAHLFKTCKHYPKHVSTIRNKQTLFITKHIKDTPQLKHFHESTNNSSNTPTALGQQQTNSNSIKTAKPFQIIRKQKQRKFTTHVLPVRCQETFPKSCNNPSHERVRVDPYSINTALIPVAEACGPRKRTHRKRLSHGM